MKGNYFLEGEKASKEECEGLFKTNRKSVTFDYHTH